MIGSSFAGTGGPPDTYSMLPLPLGLGTFLRPGRPDFVATDNLMLRSCNARLNTLRRLGSGSSAFSSRISSLGNISIDLVLTAMLFGASILAVGNRTVMSLWNLVLAGPKMESANSEHLI